MVLSIDGHDVYIDDADYELCKGKLWHIHADGYAFFRKNKKYTFMHNFILGKAPNHMIVVDHINENRLDNRRKNLRIVNKSINALNKGKSYSGTLSKYKGVSSGKGGRWRAYIDYNKKRYTLGSFVNEIDAARAYNLFVIKYIKISIRLNSTGDDYCLYTPIPKPNRKNKYISF